MNARARVRASCLPSFERAKYIHTYPRERHEGGTPLQTAMAFAAPPQVPKNEQGYGLMTARRRAKLELLLEREKARDATSKRLQAQHGRKAAYDDVVNVTVRVRYVTSSCGARRCGSCRAREWRRRVRYAFNSHTHRSARRFFWAVKENLHFFKKNLASLLGDVLEKSVRNAGPKLFSLVVVSSLPFPRRLPIIYPRRLPTSSRRTKPVTTFVPKAGGGKGVHVSKVFRSFPKKKFTKKTPRASRRRQPAAFQYELTVCWVSLFRTFCRRRCVCVCVCG